MEEQASLNLSNPFRDIHVSIATEIKYTMVNIDCLRVSMMATKYLQRIKSFRDMLAHPDFQLAQSEAKLQAVHAYRIANSI